MKKHRLVSILLVLTLLLAALPIGCGGNVAGTYSSDAENCNGCTVGNGNNEGSTDMLAWNQKNVTTTLVVQTYTNDSEPTIYDQNHTRLTNDQIKSLITQLPKDGKSAIELNILDPIDPSSVQTLGGWGFQVGKYYVRLSWEKHMVRSCINRDVWHLGFLIKNNSIRPERIILDSHACSWWQNGPQFGLYNSANGWCAQSRGTWSEIRGKVLSALAVVGVTGLVAYVIAEASTAIIVGAFAL